MSDCGTPGILVGGGPAPGINGMIGAVTIGARDSGLEAVGIYDGFAHLMEGKTEPVRRLKISEVSQIHFQGGSILRTSRANPTRNRLGLQNVSGSLRKLGANYLVTAGGDDTAFSASEAAKAANRKLPIFHVPKTIGNDLPLPGNMPTFGFETARHFGTAIVRNLMEDSRTANRWYFIGAMGRSSGHLALRIGKAAGATPALIPEEFDPEAITLDRV